MPNDTADMSSSNNSTSRESTVAMPIPSGSNEFEATAQASAQASGVASNAFGIRDNQGVVPLSLPPEGTFESWEAVKKAAKCTRGVSWLCSRRRKRGTEGSRQEISLEKIPDLQARRVALSRQNSPKRGAEETQESNVEKYRLRSQVESPRAPRWKLDPPPYG